MNILDKVNDSKDIKKLSLEELEELSNEIRKFLVDNISKTGGHLASNLGIVELTLALFKNFDFTKDKIVFDVGHQSYVYKMFTGRKDKFSTLRKYQGMSGFPKRSESKFDYFDTGHSSNSISACLGMARARDLKKENYDIISVIGDGAFTGGMVYEALNDVGFKPSKMIIILNDNQMSISLNVGGIAKCLNKIRLNTSYNRLKEKVHHKLDRRTKVVNLAKKVKNSIKSLFFNQMFFESLGVKYIGPIDGNNISELDKVIKKVKGINKPVVLHVTTVKGLGYTPALLNPDKFHATGRFDIETGNLISKGEFTYSAAFGSSLINLAKKDKDIVVITAAMTSGTGLTEFSKRYTDRVFDVGITEGHAVTLASGMAISGLKPIFVVYSTFLQRGFDQILMDVCMQKLPVVFAIDRAGLVGQDGKTHQGVFDISYLNMMPNIEIISPKVTDEMEIMLKYALEQKNPIAIRYPRGGDIIKLNSIKSIKKGTWEKVSDGENVVVLAVGRMVSYAIKAKEILKNKLNPIIVNALFVKPLDINYLNIIIKENYNVLTLEDNNIIGGFGQQVLYNLNKLGFKNKIKIMGYEDSFIDHGSVDELLKQEKMSIDNIVDEIENLTK